MGFSTTCLPFLVYAVGLKRGMPLILLPSLASNFFIMKDAGHFREVLVRFWPMLLATVGGVIIGLWLLNLVPVIVATTCLGGVLSAYAIFGFFTPNFRLPAKVESILAPVSGLMTGVLNGLTGSQVMPVLPYLLSLNLNRNEYLQAINCSFSLSTIVMAIGLYKIGLLEVGAASITILSLPLVYIGTKLGGRVRNMLPDSVFTSFVHVFLFVLGASLIF